MNVDTVLDAIEQTLSQETGRHLSDLQTEILRGTWLGEKYEAIATKAYCTEGHVKDVAAQLWQQLSLTLGEKISKKNIKCILAQKIHSGELVTQNLPNPIFSDRDWGTAPDVSSFLGRTQELTILKQWILDDRCHIVTLLGMGGIGKTSLAAKVAYELDHDFEFIIWRSLHHAPHLKSLLTDLIQFFSQKEDRLRPDYLDGLILGLLDCCRSWRCLLILDNAESILQSGVRTGAYRSGYEEYAQLFKAIAQTQHQSCFLLTSREKPQGLRNLEGEAFPVRCFQLSGLSAELGAKLFSIKGKFKASTEQWQNLTHQYVGNPLALKIVASAIADWFAGDIGQFLDVSAQESFLLDDLNSLLKQHFERLSNHEQMVLYWLAINREPITLRQLSEDLVGKASIAELLQVATALQHRSLIEKTANSLTLQPVVMEYVTYHFIEEVVDEITNGKFNLFHRHALIKAQAHDYIREIQTRLILKPIVEQLVMIIGNRKNLAQYLRQCLAQLKIDATGTIGYAAGNLFNLMREIDVEFTQDDFSGLSVWQANCQGINLSAVNFSHSDLSQSRFSESLESILSVAVSPDGLWLATGEVNGQIRLWRLPHGQQVLCFQAHDNWIRSLAFSPDNQTLASASYDKSVKLWEISSGHCLATYSEHLHGISGVAFSPLGGILASSSYDHSIKIWSIAQGICLKTLSGHQDWVNAVAFSPNGEILASGSADSSVKLWDIRSGQCLNTFIGHKQGVSSVTFSPNGQRLATGSADSSIKLWSIKEHRYCRTFTGHQDWINSLAFQEEGHLLASGSADTTVKIWDIRSGQCQKTCLGHHNAVWSVAFIPQQPILVSGSFDYTLKFWHLQTGQSLKNLEWVYKRCALCSNQS